VPGTGPSPWRPTPADPGALFDPVELDRSRRYHRPLRRVRALRTAARVAVLVAVVALDGAGRLVGGLGVSGWVAQLAVVLVASELVLLVVDLPLDAWLELVHDRRWGLSTQRGTGLARDVALGAVVSLATGLALLVPIYALARVTPWWWLWAWLLVCAYAVLAGLLVPLVLARLFNRFALLDDPALAGRVRAVADRAGVPIGRVLVADESRRSRRDNAYVSGLGPTRRIVLYDTLLETPAELVEQVVAHELGHVRRHHLARQLPVLAGVSLVALAALGALSGWSSGLEAVGLDGPGDPTGLPLALLVAGGLGAVLAPLPAWVSRAFERQADLDALDLLGRPDRVEAMLRRLHARNLADLAPGRLERLGASHPPVAERIALARMWPNTRGG
jgi:STE24 endopeptidase